MQLDFLRQSVCGSFSLATDFYGYGYTSYQNLTEVSVTLERIKPLINISLDCEHFGIFMICNYVFPPCDLTTGMLRSVCTESCYFFRTHCSETYHSAVAFASAAQYPLEDNCENTLIHLQLRYGFPCSSSSLQSDCIDIKSM